MILCASPDYLAEHGTPKSPEDLQQHRCLHYRYRAGTLRDGWHLRKGKESYNLVIKERLRCDDWNGLQRASRLGFGIALGPEIALREDMDAGALVHIMPEFPG